MATLKQGCLGEYHARIRMAFRDWLSKRAYLDNSGNFRVRADKRRIAPWNKEVKKTFPSVEDFHRAALRYGEAVRQREPFYKEGKLFHIGGDE